MLIKTKRHITLIEIMIVMFLIALITGVLAYNYRGSLEQGKVFKTKQAMDKLETILNLAVSENPDELDRIEEDWKEIVKKSPLVKSPGDLIRDGWGIDYKVEKTPEGQIQVTSEGLAEYEKNQK